MWDPASALWPAVIMEHRSCPGQAVPQNNALLISTQIFDVELLGFN